jgi:hypothetical protein
LFVSVEAFRRVKGYRTMGVYAGDDAFLLIDFYNARYSLQVLETLPVIHPPSPNDEYKKWKNLVLQQHTDGYRKSETNKLMKGRIQDATIMWPEYYHCMSNDYIDDLESQIVEHCKKNEIGYKFYQDLDGNHHYLFDKMIDFSTPLEDAKIIIRTEGYNRNLFAGVGNNFMEMRKLAIPDSFKKYQRHKTRAWML